MSSYLFQFRMLDRSKLNMFTSLNLASWPLTILEKSNENYEICVTRLRQDSKSLANVDDSQFN